MSEKQLNSFLEAVESDPSLQEKILAAQEIDEAVRIAIEAGFDVNIADWLKRQAQEMLKLDDEDLINVAAGRLIANDQKRQLAAAGGGIFGVGFVGGLTGMAIIIIK